MAMVCNESGGDGMKIAKLNDGEPEAKKRVNKILRQVTKLQEMKPAAKKHAARISMILEQVNKLEEEMTYEEKVEQAKMRMRQIYSGGTNVTYDRDTTTCYPPERMQRLIRYAQMAIDVFNQRQPIKYSVVEVLRATTRLVTGFIVHLKFTAKPDDDGDDDDAKTFAASVYCGIRCIEVTYVELSST